MYLKTCCQQMVIITLKYKIWLTCRKANQTSSNTYVTGHARLTKLTTHSGWLLLESLCWPGCVSGPRQRATSAHRRAYWGLGRLQVAFSIKAGQNHSVRPNCPAMSPASMSMVPPEVSEPVQQQWCPEACVSRTLPTDQGTARPVICHGNH